MIFKQLIVKIRKDTTTVSQRELRIYDNKGEYSILQELEPDTQVQFGVITKTPIFLRVLHLGREKIS